MFSEKGKTYVLQSQLLQIIHSMNNETGKYDQSSYFSARVVDQ